MTLTLQPVLLANRHDDEAQLVFVGDRLLGLLVRLSEMHEGMAGSWFLEFAFDDLDHPPQSVFPDLDTALEWIAERLSGNPP
jgi:hypothetical protein